MALEKGIRRVKPRELRDVYVAADRLGCEVRLTGGGHVRIETPGGLTIGPKTASDIRAVKNVRALLRRQGLDL